MSIRPALLILALLSPLPSHALFYVAGGEVILTTRLSVEYDSNVFANAAEESDLIGTLNLDLSFQREFRLFRFGSGGGISFVRFNDFSERDRTNWNFMFLLEPTAEFGTRTWSLDTDIGFARRTSSDVDVGDIVTTDEYRAGFTLGIFPTPRYYFQFNPLYRLTKPQDFEAADRKSFSMAATAGWRYSARLSFVTSVNRTKLWSDDTEIENVTWAYSVGAVGALTPKLNGNLSVGFQRRELESTGETSTTPTVSASLFYRIDPTNSLSLSASRSFDTALTNQNLTNTRVALGYTRQMRRDLTGHIELAATERSFETVFFDRKDRSYSGTIRLTYQVAAWGVLEGSLQHQIQESNLGIFDYSRTIFRISLIGRF